MNVAYLSGNIWFFLKGKTAFHMKHCILNPGGFRSPLLLHRSLPPMWEASPRWPPWQWSSRPQPARLHAHGTIAGCWAACELLRFLRRQSHLERSLDFHGLLSEHWRVDVTSSVTRPSCPDSLSFSYSRSRTALCFHPNPSELAEFVACRPRQSSVGVRTHPHPSGDLRD